MGAADSQVPGARALLVSGFVPKMILALVGAPLGHMSPAVLSGVGAALWLLVRSSLADLTGRLQTIARRVHSVERAGGFSLSASAAFLHSGAEFSIAEAAYDLG